MEDTFIEPQESQEEELPPEIYKDKEKGKYIIEDHELGLVMEGDNFQDLSDDVEATTESMKQDLDHAKKRCLAKIVRYIQERN